MKSPFVLLFGAIILLLSLSPGALAQTPRDTQKKKNEPKRSEPKQPAPAPAAQPSPEDAPPDDSQEMETVKVNTNLVTVPVIANDREGDYVPDLRKEEFTIYEDGVRQELSFFATIDEPFHVVLMIDTSASTQIKLRQIQRAAIEFTEELQPADRLKVISFDDQVRDLSDFSNDRLALQTAIQRTRPGRGTKLYDAMRLALEALRPIKGRKAIVIFTDGVDWHSDEATFDENRRMIEESGVIVYPIRYDTRAETERMAREQAGGAGKMPDLATILGKGGSGGSGGSGGGGGRTRGGTTPPTFPGGGGPSQIPGGGTMGLPVPPIIVRREPRDPDMRRYPDPSSNPDPSGRRTTDPRAPTGRPDERDNGGYPERRPAGDSISEMLDNAYRLADDYLDRIATSSGGKLTRADTLSSLPAAFAEIAAELRTQYSLGYYPPSALHDGQYHKIQVKTNRKGVVLRARPGYRAPGSKPSTRKR